jgi:imidazolonepropionase-like amidohydrolase
MKINRTRPLLAITLSLSIATAFLFATTNSHAQRQAHSRAQTQDRKLKALVGGTLIDGFGSQPIRNSVVIIEGERIKAGGQVGSLAVPIGAEVISTEGMTVLPGLWDMHVHLMINGHSDYTHWDKTYPPLMENVIMPASARQLLMAGVTSARDLGGPLEASIAVRDRINKGQIAGPTIYISGPFIQHEPYPGTEYFRWGVKGADDARAKVRRLAEAGVNIIKLIDQDQMTMEEVLAVVDEAHKHKLPVVAHAHRPEEIRRGLIAGVDCFEHTGLASAPEYPPDIIAMLRERTAKMSLGPMFWTPTVQGLLNYEYVRDNPEQLDDPSWQVGLPPSIIDDIKNSLKHPNQLSYYQLTPLRRPTLARKIQQLSESGVVLLIGTDSGIPMNFHSQTTWRELDAWVNEFKIDPMVAIRAATYWPSVAMKVSDQVGTVSEGKYADVIAVRGDVLRYINLLQNVDVVIKHGRRYK